MGEACRLVRVDRSTSKGLADMAREFEDAGDHRLKLALEDPDAFFAHIERFESAVSTSRPTGSVKPISGSSGAIA